MVVNIDFSSASRNVHVSQNPLTCVLNSMIYELGGPKRHSRLSDVLVIMENISGTLKPIN